MEINKLDVQVQVVAGINYKFSLYSGDMVIVIVIWRKLDGTMKVTSSEIKTAFDEKREKKQSLQK